MKQLAYFFIILFVSVLLFTNCESNMVTSQENGSQNELSPMSGFEKKAAGDKVYLLHMTGTGEYILIEVNQNAVDAHLAHGDLIACAPYYNQGFESNTDGWFDINNGWYGVVTRVSSGTSGINSVDGNWHAVFEGDATSAPFTRFDGYCNIWTPWTAELDVYLDPGWSLGQGFDYTVASSRANGDHLRDFIFHVGVTDLGLLVNGSNNTDFFANPYKLKNDNGGNYYEVTSAGWYTLQHRFYNDNGALAVDLNLVDANGDILWTATRTNTADAIPDVVGGNRYGWFTFINVAGGIAVDEQKISRDF